MFQVCVIWEDWFPGVIIQLKDDHLKSRNIALAGQQQKSVVKKQTQIKNFFLLEFRLVWEVKNWPSYKKECHIGLGTTKRINKNFLKFPWILLEVFNLILLLFKMFGSKAYSSNWKMVIVRPGMTCWVRNDKKITSQNNLLLNFYNRSWDMDKDY